MSTRIVCINLERRPERKETMLQRTKGLQFDFYNAVDGTTLEITPEIKKIFEKNNFNWRLGIMGCALSHYYLWKELIADDKDYYLILEDDTELHPNFNTHYLNISYAMIRFNVSFLFLGHHYSNYQNYEFNLTDPLQIKRLNKWKYGGGTGGYIISKHAAQSLVNWIDTYGCREPIDHLLTTWDESCNQLFVCEPHIVKNLIGGDSDVQVEFPRAQV